MSYIQIEIGGKLRGLKFTQGTNILLQDKLVALDLLERKAFGTQYIIWAGLKTNAVIKDEALTKTVEVDGKLIEEAVTFEDICDWVPDISDPKIIEVINLYSEVNNYLLEQPEASADDEKKNQPETTEQIVTDLPGS